MGGAKFSDFQECTHKAMKVSSSDQNDYYSKSRKSILDEIDALALLVQKKKISQKTAYSNLQVSMMKKITEESQQAQTAGAVMAVMLVGVAAASCAHNGCGGGGGYNSYAGYDGNCRCPYDRDVAGNICGARSAYSRSGGASPICY